VLSIPVISVGNLTVGGTGKTPFVVELVKRLDRLGCSPAVVSRGYKAAVGEPNDEELLIRRNCPGVVCVSDPDRALACEIARSDLGADVIVLDDGFQHRRVARVLDVVLIDATCPFGFDHLLPRGLLREPVQSLQRAHIIVVTRCDQVSQADLARILGVLRKTAGDAVHLQCRHRVTSVECLDGTRVDGPLDGKRAVLFAGVGQPGAFATTVRSMGVDVVGECWWPDHHRYRYRDVSSLFRARRFPPHDMLITTEKDAVKLAGLGGIDRPDILVVRIAIDFADDGGTMLQEELERVLQRD
jgi:tetraacyldisaccharide 4'-kinase